MSATRIPLDKAVRDRLKKYGTVGSTYTQIVTKLMDQVDRKRFLDEIRSRAAKNKNWTRLEEL